MAREEIRDKKRDAKTGQTREAKRDRTLLEPGEDAIGSTPQGAPGSPSTAERERAQRRTRMEQPTTGNARDEQRDIENDVDVDEEK